ncbi:MAG TPA: hypothetical protein VN228_15405 [Pyrinomonadaceae bacterium]|nr:hypothetical protein [Pyrinomonadaceae bacterium]
MRRTFARTLTILAAAAALVFQQAAAAAPQAATITDNATVPIEFITTSCSGEPVIINGESHVVFHATGTPGGQQVARFHINFRLSGESASGARYVVNETVNSTETRDADGAPSTFASVSHLNVVSTGGAENLRVRTTIHTTVNANGEITATSFEFTTECGG